MASCSMQASSFGTPAFMISASVSDVRRSKAAMMMRPTTQRNSYFRGTRSDVLNV